MSTYAELDAKAREAEQEASRLAHKAREARTAELAAEADRRARHAQWRLAVHTPKLAQARADAEAEWSRVAADPEADLVALFAAFSAAKIASATYIRSAQENAGYADSHLGTRSMPSGQQVGRVAPVQDPWAAITFADALEQAIRARTAAAVAHQGTVLASALAEQQ